MKALTWSFPAEETAKGWLCAITLAAASGQVQRYDDQGASLLPAVRRMPLQLRDGMCTIHEPSALAERATLPSISGRDYADQMNRAG
jgi:hypothetical protein